MGLQFGLTGIKKMSLLRIIVLTCYLGVQIDSATTDSSTGQCCTGASNPSHTNGSVPSFTESFIANRTARTIDLKKLVTNYSLICPVQRSCGVAVDNKFIFTDELSPEITGCRECTCDRSCVTKGNCCPGTHFGYVQHTCININMYPKDMEESYNMVCSCLDTFNDNITVIEKCKAKVEPCIGKESGLIYKNWYCGKCNYEPDCVIWKLGVECKNEKSFQDKTDSFTSAQQMKNALSEDTCRIRFRLPVNEIEFPCTETEKRHTDKYNLINKCNVSGLWDNYDPDIDWACRNFATPYKEFKNVFCYICNPSRGSKQFMQLEDDCSQAGNDSISKTYNACLSLPATARYAPYKNVYCYMCSQKYSALFGFNDMSLTDISEKIDLDMETHLNITLEFSGKHNTDNLLMFVVDLLKEYSQENKHTDQTEESENIYGYDAPDLIEIHRIYAAICGSKTLCNFPVEEHHRDMKYGNPVCKSCACESTCAESRTCCPDILFDKRPYSCLSHTMFPSFYNIKDTWKHHIKSGVESEDLFMTIDRCINDDVDDNVKQKCSHYNEPDYLSQIPVGTEAGITYKNINCYACNNNKSILNLTFQVYCNSYIEHTLFRSTNQLLNAIKNYCREITFVPFNRKTCLKGYDAAKAGFRGGEKFIRRELHPSQFEFKVTTYVGVEYTDYYKPVRNVFDRCNKTSYWNAETDIIRNVCGDTNVNMMSLPEYRIENNVYKNFACFICNPDVNLSRIENSSVTSECLLNRSVEWYQPDTSLDFLCSDADYEPIWFPFKNLYCSECNRPPLQLVVVEVLTSAVLPAATYKYIFSLSLMDFEHLDTVIETEVVPDCNSGTYDHALKQCRQMSCNVGLQLKNSKCQPLLESASHHQYNVTFNLHHVAMENMNSSENNREVSEPFIVKFKDVCNGIVDSVTDSFGKPTNYIIDETECIGTSHCLILQSNSNFSSRQTFIDFFHTNLIRIRFSVAVVYTESISLVHMALVKALNRRFYLTDILDEYGINQTIVLQSKPNLEKYSSLYSFSMCTHRGSISDSKNSRVQFSKYTVDHFFICGHVKLNVSEVTFDENKINLKQVNVTFTAEEYKIVDQTIIICADDFRRRTYREPVTKVITRTNPIKSTLIVFSLICTVISLLCLFLTFITYCFMSSLRSLAGKNIMLLCVSLFCSQALLQFGINVTNETSLCVGIGICIQFSWLGSFCAMNLCSFHTFKVFYYNDVSSRSSNSASENRSFLKYLIYFICLPTLIVGITVSVSLIKSNLSDLGYGEYYCFISDFYIFIFTFVTPACLIFLSNIVFFSVAFHKIRTAPNVQHSHDRNNFYICLRLCTIVGVAWPLLIIDSTLQISWFSFVVAGVNSLQGVFIFVSFVLNRRVASFFISSIAKKVEELMNVTGMKTTYLQHSGRTEST